MAVKSKSRPKPRRKNGKAKTTRKEVCFVIMPFGGWLDDYYQSIYKPAIEAAGLAPHRADDLFRPSTIVNDIWAYTKAARVLVADLTGKNPNVFYELGLAHALAKPAIIVAESMDDVPFDLRALRVLVYDKNAPNWGTALKEKVETSIREVLKSPKESVLPAFLDTKGMGQKPTLTPHEKELLELRQQIEGLREGLRAIDRPNEGRRIHRRDAEALVERLVAEGASVSAIGRQLTSLGAPEGWIEDFTREAYMRLRAPERARRLREAKPTNGGGVRIVKAEAVKST
jgi:hypothetical protein